MWVSEKDAPWILSYMATEYAFHGRAGALKNPGVDDDSAVAESGGNRSLIEWDYETNDGYYAALGDGDKKVYCSISSSLKTSGSKWLLSTRTRPGGTMLPRKTSARRVMILFWSTWTTCLHRVRQCGLIGRNGGRWRPCRSALGRALRPVCKSRKRPQRLVSEEPSEPSSTRRRHS